MVKETEYYDLLGVNVDATDEQIRTAYRKEALKCHPYRPSSDPEKFEELCKAFQILSDSKKRAIYDTEGSEGNLSEEKIVNPTMFFVSVFYGGAFKSYLGDIHVFGELAEDDNMDENSQDDDNNYIIMDDNLEDDGSEVAIFDETGQDGEGGYIIMDDNLEDDGSEVAIIDETGQNGEGGYIIMDDNLEDDGSEVAIIDETGLDGDAHEVSTDKEAIDMVNNYFGNFAPGFDLNNANDQDIKKAVKAQRKAMKIQRKNKNKEVKRQRKIMAEVMEKENQQKIEEMTTDLNSLLDSYFLHQKQNTEKEYLKNIRKDVDSIKNEPYGLALVWLIGSLYIENAKDFIKSNKPFGIPRAITNSKRKMEMKKEAHRAIHFAQQFTKDCDTYWWEVGNPDLTPEERDECDKKIIPGFLKSIWLVLQFESTVKIRKVCENILYDSKKSKKERLERAKALVVIGDIFDKITRTKEEQEEAELFEYLIIKSRLNR